MYGITTSTTDGEHVVGSEDGLSVNDLIPSLVAVPLSLGWKKEVAFRKGSLFKYRPRGTGRI